MQIQTTPLLILVGIIMIINDDQIHILIIIMIKMLTIIVNILTLYLYIICTSTLYLNKYLCCLLSQG